MATTLLDLDLIEGSVQIECDTEWGEPCYDIFMVDKDGRKYHFVGTSGEEKVYVTILNADNSPVLLNKALYKSNGEGGYEFVLLPKGYSESEITNVCVEFVDTMN